LVNWNFDGGKPEMGFAEGQGQSNFPSRPSRLRATEAICLIDRILAHLNGYVSTE
jgi:hypothetical protein